jgi:hypothetical protein
MNANVIDKTLAQLRGLKTLRQDRMRAILARAGARALRPDEQKAFDQCERELMTLRIDMLEARLLAVEGDVEDHSRQVAIHWGTREEARAAALGK